MRYGQSDSLLFAQTATLCYPSSRTTDLVTAQTALLFIGLRYWEI